MPSVDHWSLNHSKASVYISIILDLRALLLIKINGQYRWSSIRNTARYFYQSVGWINVSGPETKRLTFYLRSSAKKLFKACQMLKRSRQACAVYSSFRQGIFLILKKFVSSCISLSARSGAAYLLKEPTSVHSSIALEIRLHKNTLITPHSVLLK